ncbi:uncharacterized protein [Miscanthus floridulus]|uniref:uncharacterized protein n=1 Tax=Miscanthus floridulus TaxID=154761 RepID=UPI003458B713
MVDPIVDTKRLTKLLMDGGRGLNILYAKTLDKMGIDQTRVHPTEAPFHNIVPKKHDMPHGQMNLPITFRDPSNYRMETLTFEVVGFPKTYHTILGRPCYTKFMAIPNYTNLKLKILGPGRVITISTSFQCAYECEVECCDHAAAIVTSRELAAIKKEVTKKVPKPKKSTGSFEPMEGSKEVFIDLDSSNGKVVRISTALSTNRKMRSSTFSAPTKTSLR